MPGSVRKVRERINLRLYSSKNPVLNVLRVMRLVVGVCMVGFLIYFHGFSQMEGAEEFMLILVRGSYVFFIISFLTRLLFDFEPKKFLHANMIEGWILAVLFFDLMSALFLDQGLFQLIFYKIASERAGQLFGLFSQLLLLAIVMFEFGRISQRINLIRTSPAVLFMCSFLVLITGGTLLLLMPEMTVSETPMPFLQALFTSTSASCVTGLIVVDTATYFSFKGQILIMILIQLGGLNIISFASFFAAFSRAGVGLRQNLMIKELMSYESLSGAKQLLKQVVILTFCVEILGAILIYFSWDPNYEFVSIENKIFHSVFHAISAFNNAGFSTFSMGLFEPILRDSYMLHIIVAGLVIVGGLGIPVIHDMFSIKRMRERLHQPWKRLHVTSRLALYTSIALIVAGASFFFILETQNVHQYGDGGFNYRSTFQQVIASVFQSVSSRTSGFNTVDFGVISTPTLLVFILLMFIGASPGGTGGGIKTTTFAVALLSAIATIRGKKTIEIFRHTITSNLMYKAFSIFLFSLSIVFIGTFILAITDPQIDLLKLAFEVVSAFSTTGLSTGITDSLSDAGTGVIIATMFIGRVGVLTLAFALSKKVISTRYKYPEAHVMIG